MPTSSMILLILEQLQKILQEWPAEAYFVGGCVRDLLLGRPLHDLDLVAAGDAPTLARAVARAFHAAFVLLDEENGIARVVLRGPEGSLGDTVDFARMRGDSLLEDLRARDLTINAMAMTPPPFVRFVRGETDLPEIIDPCGGQRDLRAGLLRAVSPRSLYDDPLRSMRVVRFAGELGFAVDPETASWVRQTAALLAQVSWERLRDELFRLLACAHAAPYLPLLDDLGLLPHVLPELEQARDEPGLPHLWERVCALEWLAAGLEVSFAARREEALWRPAALSVHSDLPFSLPYAAQLQRYLRERVAGDRTRLALLKLAALLLPSAPTAADGAVARQAGQRLRLSAREVQALGTAVAIAASPVLGASASSRDIYRFYRDGGDMALGGLLLALAEDLARAGPALERGWWEERVQGIAHILAARFERTDEVIDPPRLVDGGELMRMLGLPPGPLVGDLLEGIREAQAAGEVRNRDQALAWARRALERQG